MGPRPLVRGRHFKNLRWVVGNSTAMPLRVVPPLGKRPLWQSPVRGGRALQRLVPARWTVSRLFDASRGMPNVRTAEQSRRGVVLSEQGKDVSREGAPDRPFSRTPGHVERVFRLFQVVLATPRKWIFLAKQNKPFFLPTVQRPPPPRPPLLPGV